MGLVEQFDRNYVPQLAPNAYTVKQSNDGGWNYFFNGKPITREAYASGSGKGYSPDPVRTPQTAALAPAPAYSGGSSASAYVPPKVDKSNDIALQMAGLGAVDSQLGTGLGSIDTALSRLNGQYDTETTANEGDYRVQGETNQNNLQKSKQTALVNAAQGRRGLFGTLAGLGALNGSGIDLANRAVAKGANDDLAGAGENYSSNQQALDTAIGVFRREDKMRRENAVTAADNARTNVRNEAAKSRMSFLSNLANDYSAQGDEAPAKKYAAQAAALYPELAKTSIPNSNIAYTGAAFTPGSLASYLAGANSTQVSTTPTQGGSLPGLVASPTKKKLLQPA